MLLAAATIGGWSYGQTQSEMTAQAMREADEADKQLNAVYQKLMALKPDAERREKILAAQRAWLKFRDAQVDLEGDIVRGGSMEPQLRAMCIKRMTDERTATLQWLIDIESDTPATRPSR